MIIAAGDAITREEGRLAALDSAIGDGDHGVTMRIGFQAVKKKFEAEPLPALPGQVFIQAGREFMRSTGGAIGVILGRALMAAGEAIRDRNEMGSAEWKLCFVAMEQTVRVTGKAVPGDKTLLDPLHAVNDAISCIADNSDSSALLGVAASAAEAAAQATAALRCRKGRASRLGDRAIGHPDPGAVSFSIIARAFAVKIRELPLGDSLHSR